MTCLRTAWPFCPPQPSPSPITRWKDRRCRRSSIYLIMNVNVQRTCVYRTPVIVTSYWFQSDILSFSVLWTNDLRVEIWVSLKAYVLKFSSPILLICIWLLSLNVHVLLFIRLGPTSYAAVEDLSVYNIYHSCISFHIVFP